MTGIAATTASSDNRTLLTKITMSLLLLTMLGNLGALTTSAAFSSATANKGNSFVAGTVVLTDNDAGESILSMANLKPGDESAGCIQVNYSGSLPATVRLYGTTGGSGLDQFLDVKVTRGSFTGPSTAGSCTNFSADAADYLGEGAGVIYSGTLRGFADTHDAGIVDPHSGAAATWTKGESHVYRFEVRQVNDNAAQGLDASQVFRWEARS